MLIVIHDQLGHRSKTRRFGSLLRYQATAPQEVQKSCESCPTGVNGANSRNGTTTSRQMSFQKRLNVLISDPPERNPFCAEPSAEVFDSLNVHVDRVVSVSANVQIARERLQNYGEMVGSHPAPRKRTFEKLLEHGGVENTPCFQYTAKALSTLSATKKS